MATNTPGPTHTPDPWAVLRRGGMWLITLDGTVEAMCYTESVAGAACHALNCHADLLAAVRELLEVRTGDGLLDPACAAFLRGAAALAKATAAPPRPAN